MLTIQRKRGSVAALAVLLLAPVVLTGGTAMVPVQAQTLDGGATTLTPGEGASPQEELLAEALGAMVRAGFNPADFDMEKAVFDPQGRAVFLPVRVTDEFEEQLQALAQGEQRSLLMGVLYTREPFEFQGKRYGQGVHPVVLENVSAADVEGQRPANDPRIFNEGPGYEGGSCNNNSGSCVTVEISGPTGSGTYVINLPAPPQPGPGVGGVVSRVVRGLCATAAYSARWIPHPVARIVAVGVAATCAAALP